MQGFADIAISLISSATTYVHAKHGKSASLSRKIKFCSHNFLCENPKKLRVSGNQRPLSDMRTTLAALELEHVKNLDTLTGLFKDPYISRIGHDHRELAPIEHPHVKYLSAKLNGKQVGAFMIVESGFVEIDIHAMLSKKAIQHSREFGRLCLEWAFSQNHINRVTAYIIDGLNSAKNYCVKLGFKNEGMRRGACLKNGQLVGVHILGMTRQDWEKLK